MRARFRRVALTSVLLLLVLSVGGTAYAHWTATGSGSGTGTTGTTVAITVGPGTAVTNLRPGANANVKVTATNTNYVDVFVGSLALDTSQGTGGFAVDAGHSGCSLATLSFTTATNGGAGWTVPAKVGAVDGTLTGPLTNALAMSTGAANACQGATFTVYLVAGP